MARLSEVSKTAAAPKAVPVPNSVSQNSPVTTVVTAATTPATPIAFQELTELREKAKQVDDSAQKAKEAEEAKQKALTDKQTAEQQAEQLRKDAETLQNQLDDAKQRADFQEEQANANLDRAQDAEKALRKAEENLDNTADDWQRKLESKEADRRALEVELKGDDETTGLRDELRIAKRRANNAKSKFHATLAVGSIVAALLLVFTIVLAVSNSGLKKDVQWYIDEYESGEQLPSLDD
ncbi:MAG: hypothetical protein LBM97_01495, partial [Candidatus Nomurabacteria bacterium]|nr:hypothetical protein [Candidatus Nomurabacteria bacterium]